MASLFEDMTIAGMTARNRIVRAATAESLATPSGKPTAQLTGLYRTLAAGGIGTIITGYGFVAPDGKPSDSALSFSDDTAADDCRALVEAAHGGGARIVAQLVYGGSKSKLALGDPRWLPTTDSQRADCALNASILGPSAIENPKTHLVPLEASADDLKRVARAFGQAAARARAWGFDGVEVHAAHGYLLSQFLSRRFNVREDAYGGTLENRARFPLEVVSEVRGEVGEGFPILVKLNSCDDFEDAAGARGGLSEDESAQVAAWLVEAGADCIDVSGDWHNASSRVAVHEPYFAAFGARLARDLDAPVLVTGGWRSLGSIEEHLACDGIAGIGMSRPLICEPDLPARWLSGDRNPSKCTGCGHCMKQAGIPCSRAR